MPDATVAGGPELLVRAAIAPLYAEARVSSTQVSQRLAGHVVRVLAREGDWLRVAGDDAYEGWMHTGAAEPLADADRAALAAARVSLGCAVRDPRTGRRRPLPPGALVMPDEDLLDGEAVTRALLAARCPRDGAAIARSAEELFSGAPYQWGGITPWGTDCSGLVQTVYGLHGVAMPRDAWQQAACGTARAEAPERLAPGDLLFFSECADGRVTHVGISLGSGRMAHAALGRGGHAVERWDDADAYTGRLRGRLVGARRVAGS